MTELVPIHGLDVIASRRRFRSEMNELAQQLAAARSSLSATVGEVSLPSVALPEGDASSPGYISGLTADVENRRTEFVRQRSRLAELRQELQTEIARAAARRKALIKKAIIAGAALVVLAWAWLAL